MSIYGGICGVGSPRSVLDVFGIILRLDDLKEFTITFKKLEELERHMNNDTMHRAKAVKPLDGYRLLIWFDDDDSIRIFDCHQLLDDPLFERIKAPDFFRSVHIDEMGIVCWDDSTDINPFVLYDESVEVEQAFYDGLSSLSEDFLEDGRPVEVPNKRETL